VDADLSDEWLFKPGVIGDLSAKGKASTLIGKSAFVQRVYNGVNGDVNLVDQVALL
jgi:hypothetical protein